MKCSRCQFENQDNANFCNDCGFKLNNKTNLDKYSRPSSYTPKHIAQLILSNRNTIEGERKFVTVLFVDVANSTSVFENIDPEDVHKVMNGCFQIFLDTVHQFEGTINQFRGDCVMAIFGAPIAHEDHAQRACHAALGIKQAMKGYQTSVAKQYGISFEIRIGLNTGPVVVGSIGNDLRMDYTADGDTSNLAARMESNARPGTILISAYTFNLVGKLFKINPLGKISVKGKKEPIDVYELLDRKVFRPRVGIERSIYSELVGRDKEFHTLKKKVQDVINGKGAVINITGEAGIGKSRLIAELKSLDIVDKINILEGKAISIGQNLSFHPLIDLIRNWAGIKDDDSGDIAAQKLETSIVGLGLNDFDEMLGLISTLMGIKIDNDYTDTLKKVVGEDRESLVYKNVRELFIKLCDEKAFVAIFEDLHWADLSSIGFLENLFLLAENHKILFVNTMRPNYEQTSDRLIKSANQNLGTHFFEIRLQQLDVNASESLINNMLNIQGLPVPITKKIIQKADGNPFFIEEVVRSFIDEGIITIEGDCFKASAKIDSVIIPNTINDLLIARIDRLEAANRDLIKTAAVIGRNFFYRVLKRVSGAIDDIDNRLDYLKNIQMITKNKRLDEIEYLFRHVLAQEAAYESILIDKRKPLHLEVARAIESIFRDRIHDFYGVLSYHYFRGEHLEKAEKYLLKAGEEALNASASNEAITYFKEALRLYQHRLGKDADPEKILYMHKCIAHGLYNKGRLVESTVYFNKVLPHYGVHNSSIPGYNKVKSAVCLISFLTSLYYPFLRKYKDASPKENEAVELWFRTISAYAASNKIKFVEGGFRLFNHLTRFNLKSLENGVRHLITAVALFSYGGVSFSISLKIIERAKIDLNPEDPIDRLNFITFVMLHEFFSGNFQEFRDYDQKLVESNLRLGNVLFTSYYLIQLIFRKLEKGMYPKAAHIIDLLGELVDSYRCDYAKSNYYYVIAKHKFLTRHLDDAVLAAESGIAYESKAGNLLVLSQLYSIKTRMHLLLNQLPDAEKTLLNAEKIGTGIMPPLYLSEICLSRFVLNLYKYEQKLAPGDRSDLRSVGRTVKKLGRKSIRACKKAAFNRVEALKNMGIFYWITNNEQKACNHWTLAIETGKKLKTKPELARTYFEIGKRLGEDKRKKLKLNNIDANGYLEMAESLFAELDL